MHPTVMVEPSINPGRRELDMTSRTTAARARTTFVDAVDLDLVDDLVDVWGNDSFPASDPPANW
jgi:hypothetical protein